MIPCRSDFGRPAPSWALTTPTRKGQFKKRWERIKTQKHDLKEDDAPEEMTHLPSCLPASCDAAAEFGFPEGAKQRSVPLLLKPTRLLRPEPAAHTSAPFLNHPSDLLNQAPKNGRSPVAGQTDQFTYRVKPTFLSSRFSPRLILAKGKNPTQLTSKMQTE